VNSLWFVVRMAARELKAAPRRLLLLTGTVAIGVSALVAINSFSDNLRDSVRQQSRALLGADLSLVSRQPFSRRVENLLDTLSQKGEVARVTSFGGMAYVTRTEGSRLVQVAAVSGRYPFYGQIRTAPDQAWTELHAGRHVIVDPSLLSAFNARLGDTLALGDARFVISGTIQSAPSEVGFRFALGPRIYIPAAFLEETHLLGFGARAQYEAFLRLRPETSAQQLADRYRASLRPERVTLRTVADDQRNLTDVLSRLTGYLGLVALTALLLSGIGVASAVVVLIRQRSESIAVLRCLGTTARQIVAIYLLEATMMALAGSIAGAVIGVAIQRFLPALLAGLLPVDVAPRLSWNAVLLGIATGLWVAGVFAVLPILIVRRISPLEALRRRYEPVPARRDPLWLLAFFGLAASVVVLAVHQVGSWRQGAAFSAGIAATLLLLYAVALALTRVVRHRVPSDWPYVWRQGLANLHRPANQTVVLVLAIGFGSFLLGTLYLVQHNLLRQLRLTGGPNRPNLVLFDIQADQLQGIERELRLRRLLHDSPTPIVTMRILSIKGRTITQLLASSGDSSGERSNAWALRREYRSTYRDTLVGTERLVAGAWRNIGAEGPARISVEQELAGELGIGVGDEVVWDVQGVAVPSRVASLRAVDWARFEPNFFIVFAPGSLERAPQTFVTLTRIPAAAERGRFQRELAERFPNVSILDLSLVQEALERLVNRVTLAIRFMALFSLAVGVLVLTGALASSRLQRLRETALLRTLGASRGQIFRIVLAEYCSLGMLASAAALVLATLAAWALSRFVFHGNFSIPLPGISALVIGVVLLTAIVGIANSRETVRRTPLEVLRQE
jgi:putative ABC transport system permease protein